MLLYFAGLIFYTIRRRNGGSKTKLRPSFENFSMLYSVFLVVIGLVLKIYIILRQREEVKTYGGGIGEGLIAWVGAEGLRGPDLPPRSTVNELVRLDTDFNLKLGRQAGLDRTGLKDSFLGSSQKNLALED